MQLGSISKPLGLCLAGERHFQSDPRAGRHLWRWRWRGSRHVLVVRRPWGNDEDVADIDDVDDLKPRRRVRREPRWRLKWRRWTRRRARRRLRRRKGRHRRGSHIRPRWRHVLRCVLRVPRWRMWPRRAPKLQAHSGIAELRHAVRRHGATSRTSTPTPA